MMNQMKISKQFFEDSSYGYILVAAVLACLFMALGAFAQPFFEYGFVIPCMLFLGMQLGRGNLGGSKKIFVLPGLMVAWFLFRFTRVGNDVKAATFGMAVYCSHGMERTHMDGLRNTMNLLLAYTLDI